MRAKQAAEHFGISKSTLWNWAATREGFPKPMKAGENTTLFDVNAIESYLKGELLPA